MTARRALVTGASSGIGADTVRVFRERGWDVLGTARRADRLESLAAETGAEVFAADVTDPDDVDALRDHVAATGGVHELVNIAGGAFGMDSVEHSDVEDWRRMFEVNVIAVKRLVTAFLPLLRRATDAGGYAGILNVTSIAGLGVYEGGGGYNAAKYAEHALTEVLRLELNGEPIRVIEVAPGMVRTDEFSLVRFDGDRERADAVYEGVQDPLTGRDVAVTIVDAIERPGHVDQDLIVLKPVAQAASHKLHRGPLRAAVR